jgi:aspartyl-tRNA(Asn)/glutamyl-tRNA(Gln) amidotransferase subunit B
MEEGSLRCDANVSVRRPGDPLGTRCEIKNLNSMRFVGRAIEFEARRQIEVLEGGGTIEQETRLFDAIKGETRPMRTKEEAHDYRYFPDPDLLPLELDDAFVARIEADLPELPDAKKARFMAQYGLSAYDAEVLVAERACADYFEQAAKGQDAKLVANWVIGDLFGALNRAGRDVVLAPITPEKLGKLVGLIQAGSISGRIAKDVFQKMFETGENPEQIVAEEGLAQISDSAQIEAIVDELIAANPAQVAGYQKNPKALGWFVGQVMKATKGQANPQLVNELLKKKLG